MAAGRDHEHPMEDVNGLVTAVKERFKHGLWDEDDYIRRPKRDGYRSRHLKFAFVARRGTECFNGRRIEVHIRTAVQHSCATAVEAVGLFRVRH